MSLDFSQLQPSELLTLYVDGELPELMHPTLFSMLASDSDLQQEMNEHLKKNPPPKLSAKTLEKCQQSGCYLFIVKPDVLLDILN